MMPPLPRWLLPVSLALWTGAVHSQSTAQFSQTDRTHPSKASAASSALEYQSVLSTYQRYDERSGLSWREANDLTRDIGGWRAYAKEAAADSPADQSEQGQPGKQTVTDQPSDTTSSGGAPSHGGHGGGHGGKP